MRTKILAVLVFGAVGFTAACDDKPSTGTTGSATPSGTAANKTPPKTSATTSDTAATPPKPAKLTMAEIHQAMPKKVAEAFASHDAAKIAAMYADDAKFHIQGEDISGAANIAKHDVDGIFKMAPDAKLGIIRAFWKGNEGVSEWVVSGTNTGDSMMGKATGKAFGLRGASHIVLNDDGLIKEEWLYFDSPTMMAQLGAMPGAPANMPAPAVVAQPTGAPEIHESKGGPDEAAAMGVVDKIHAAEEAKKDADVLALMADDITVWASWAMGKETKGKDSMKAMHASMDVAFPDGKETKQLEFATDGGFVILKSTFTATHKGVLKMGKEDKGIPATNKPVTLHGVSVHEVKDGKVVRAWDYGDGAELLMQLGLMKPMGQAPGAATAGATGTTAPPGTATPTGKSMPTPPSKQP